MTAVETVWVDYEALAPAHWVIRGGSPFSELIPPPHGAHFLSLNTGV